MPKTILIDGQPMGVLVPNDGIIVGEAIVVSCPRTTANVILSKTFTAAPATLNGKTFFGYLPVSGTGSIYNPCVTFTTLMYYTSAVAGTDGTVYVYPLYK